MYDIAIVGAGTAGLSAAIYAVRSGKKTVIIEKKCYGGQIINSPEVENYPGIKKISGFDFATGLYEQAMEMGAELEFGKVTGLHLGEGSKRVILEDKDIACKAIVLATGVKRRPLGIEKEEQLTGHGVSYCATCDGAFYKGQEVAVVGGGSTALEDAMFLSGYCSKVTLIHRRDLFRGEQSLVKELRNRENVEFMLDSKVTGLEGEDKLSRIRIENTNNGETSEIPVQGLFVAIGQIPDNEAYKDVIKIDEKGYIFAGEDCRTSADGVFAAGDCRTKQVRQLTTAAADGAIAGLAASQYADLV